MVEAVSTAFSSTESACQGSVQPADTSPIDFTARRSSLEMIGEVVMVQPKRVFEYLHLTLLNPTGVLHNFFDEVDDNRGHGNLRTQSHNSPSDATRHMIITEERRQLSNAKSIRRTAHRNIAVSTRSERCTISSQLPAVGEAVGGAAGSSTLHDVEGGAQAAAHVPPPTRIRSSVNLIQRLGDVLFLQRQATSAWSVDPSHPVPADAATAPQRQPSFDYVWHKLNEIFGLHRATSTVGSPH